MIDLESITLEWINKVAKENRNADKILVEKVIRALLLVEGLAKQKLQFVFKGGTSLMLLMSSTKRLSIDIILPDSPSNLEKNLDKAALEQGFIRKELNQRITQTNIKKEHYKFFYTPIHKSTASEESILLDILYEKVNYNNVIQIPIQSSFVPVSSEPVNVSVPSLEDILGDKLTSFAPNTTGIPYFKSQDSMSMEIIKQLYDIGNLLDVVNDMRIIKATFSNFAKAELAYRKQTTLNENDVLEDTYQTSLCIALRGAAGKGDFEQLLLGIRRVVRFIFSESYHLEKTITHASKAAYIAALIKHDANRIEKINNPLQLKD
ncbi:MAG: nucleotidyl transferase AbiEii/AbiGii toxin family protein [Ignavibacteriaceae bacterium]|nr:nucleotidyl transferase AbiEii/AbiGii toxin family protein [Ignavibacteriaceae bacterium]